MGVPAGVEAVLGWGGYHQGRGNAGVEGHFWSGGVTSRIGVSLLEWRSLLGRGRRKLLSGSLMNLVRSGTGLQGVGQPPVAEGSRGWLQERQ